MNPFTQLVKQIQKDSKFKQALELLKKSNELTIGIPENHQIKMLLIQALSSFYSKIIFVFNNDDLEKIKAISQNFSSFKIFDQSNQLIILNKLLKNNFNILGCSSETFSRNFPDPADFNQKILKINKNKIVSLSKIIFDLFQNGYARQEKTILPGDFSIRGNILDIYPIQSRNPFRIEFFNDQIERIFKYDLYSGDKIKDFFKIKIIPQKFSKTFKTILDWIKPQTLVIFDEPMDIKEKIKELEIFGNLLTWSAIEKAVFKKINFSAAPFETDNPIWFDFKKGEKFKGNFQRFLNRCQNLIESGYQIYISSKYNQKFSQKIISNQVNFAKNLIQGFYYPKANLAVFTDSEILGSEKILKIKHYQKKEKEFLANLRPQDFVVHVDYGIGKFTKIDFLPAVLKPSDKNYQTQKYLFLEYHGCDRLYLPKSQIFKLSKYIGSAGQKPKLSKLGSGIWERTLAKVKKNTENIARELLSIYSLREKIPGFKFIPNFEWEKHLEASFEYPETPDQKRAILEIFKDMEKAKPMDRLLAGDVGFGKTEVAIRASLRAVTSGKQVAVLAPTTVLVEQHKGVFEQRLRQFPVKIESLSRFKSKKAQKEILAKIKNGQIDLIIGTHRLLQKDVNFKDLGLVIIDEEQRFGVKHKERLKRLRAEIDVLTMTATPIPRTLQMAMAGIRQISYLKTPPEGRRPVEIKVNFNNPDLIKETILKEIKRHGQVYYLVNRVLKISQKAKDLKKIIGNNIKIASAHGQMPEEQLAKTMAEFAAGEIDILVCTTIIENGLDLANVNTLIVEDAYKFGLADLYQLKGRVGRGLKQAFGLFLVPLKAEIGKLARKRLAALLEARELGSGTKIAERDLEIRGGGNILGKEQSGHLAQIGLTLYSELLKQAIERLKPEIKKLSN